MRGSGDARYVCVSANPAILYFNTPVHSSLRTWSKVLFDQDYNYENQKDEKMKKSKTENLLTYHPAKACSICILHDSNSIPIL